MHHFRRSGKQVWNVTMFFLFFLSLYGLVGVQFFGELKHHCVRKGANVSDIQLDDLMIPDTHCTADLTSEHGYKCPPELFECKEIHLRFLFLVVVLHELCCSHFSLRSYEYRADRQSYSSLVVFLSIIVIFRLFFQSLLSDPNSSTNFCLRVKEAKGRPPLNILHFYLIYESL